MNVEEGNNIYNTMYLFIFGLSCTIISRMHYLYPFGGNMHNVNLYQYLNKTQVYKNNLIIFVLHAE